MSDGKTEGQMEYSQRLARISELLRGYQAPCEAESQAERDFTHQLRLDSAWQSAVDVLAAVCDARQIAERQTQPRAAIRKAEVILAVIDDILRPTVESHQEHLMHSAELLLENLTEAAERFSADLELLAAELRLKEQSAPSHRPVQPPPPQWRPPEGYVGAKQISTAPRFQKKGKNPPRTTLQEWEKRSSKSKSPIHVVKAPDSNECYYPEAWVHEQIQQWNPRQP